MSSLPSCSHTSDLSHFLQPCYLQKLLDECIIRDQDAEYRTVVDRFVEWCRLNHLQLNITEEKELEDQSESGLHQWNRDRPVACIS